MSMMYPLSLAIVLVSAVAKERGMCGMQCNRTKATLGDVADTGGWPSDPCSGECGSCVCPDPDWYQDRPTTVCSCVNKAANPPEYPQADAYYTLWPKQFSANEETRTWTDFNSNLSIAKGKFYYDDVNGRSRSDWFPYTNGKNASQVWIADSGSSKYYVKSGGVCLYFKISDAGQNASSVQLERHDWMKKCNDAGFGHYVGRVKEDGGYGGMEWADHYSCQVHYPAADKKDPNSNFTVTFQNFNSLGLAHPIVGTPSSNTKLGYPIRITAGNADPSQQLGTPRFTTIWYSQIDEDGVKPSDFEKPGKFCIPVGDDEAERHFGHKLSHPALRHDPDFRHRAHKLLTRTPQDVDLKRAKQFLPRKQFTAGTRAQIRQVLNHQLTSIDGLRTQACEASSLDAVHQVLREIFEVRSPSLQAPLRLTDKRRIPFANLEELARNQRAERGLLERRPDLIPIVRDARCHDAVMWFIHHLTEHAKEDFGYAGLVMPLLPQDDHVRPFEAEDDAELDQVHKEYETAVSCAVCHSETGVPSPPSKGMLNTDIVV